MAKKRKFLTRKVDPLQKASMEDLQKGVQRFKRKEQRQKLIKEIKSYKQQQKEAKQPIRTGMKRTLRSTAKGIRSSMPQLSNKKYDRQARGLMKMFDPRIKTSRKLNPQQLANLKRLRELQRQKPSNLNTNRKAVLQEFEREKIEERNRSIENNVRLSPSVRFQLERIRQIQNKGRRDDDAQQRRHRERRIISDAINLMKSHYNLRPVRMDFTGVPEDNILKADNTFRENPEDNILRTKRLNVLQTREGNNNLFF